MTTGALLHIQIFRVHFHSFFYFSRARPSR